MLLGLQDHCTMKTFLPMTEAACSHIHCIGLAGMMIASGHLSVLMMIRVMSFPLADRMLARIARSYVAVSLSHFEDQSSYDH